jgi:uncharacterized protein YjiS (DUF1127 family)
MSQLFFHTSTPASDRAGGNFRRGWAVWLSITQSNLTATIRLWIARSRERRHLAELAGWDDYVLKDIGVSRQDALREAARPFWQR